MTRIAAIDALVLDDLTKGIPGGVEAFALGELGRRRWNVLNEDLPLPLAVIRESALRHNAAWMQAFLARAGAAFAPHGKTTMSPQLFRGQLDDGAWAITVATAHQIHVCRRFGFSRVFLANQLIGRQAIRYVLDELHRDPAFDFYCLVDSLEGVALLGEAADAHPLARPVQVLVEGGVSGGRTGCRDLESALAVARAAHQAPALALSGVEGFEGLIKGDGLADTERLVAKFLDSLVALAAACRCEGLFDREPVLLSAGGSTFYDMVVARLGAADLGCATEVLTRSGCYLTHDSAMYRRNFARLQARSPDLAGPEEGLQPALQVWAYVQSCPEPEKVILTMGRRDVSSDAGWPVPELHYRPSSKGAPVPVPTGCAVVDMNDQHTHMAVPAGHGFQVGDMVAFGISHPCTTFDKWQMICLVDDDYTVTSAIRTFF